MNFKKGKIVDCLIKSLFSNIRKVEGANPK